MENTNFFEFQFIDMPDEFTLLLREDMSSSGKLHVGLQSYILKNPSLKGILNRILNHGEDVDINSHIKTLGWHGVRDRILCYYINFAKTKRHATKVNVDDIEELLRLEKVLRFSTVSGYSRLLLFGFYLILDCIENDIPELTSHPLYPSQDVIDILKLQSERVVDIDFLIIIVQHLIHFFGKDKVLAYIGENFSYESLYLKFSEEQKYQVTSNFLTYCASINQTSLFTEKTI